MARRPDTSKYVTFADVRSRLDEIVVEVRRKDLPLESSLDLFDEAVALAQKAVDFVDTEKATEEERAAAEAEVSPDGEAAATDGP